MKKFILLFIFILFIGGIFALCEEGQIDINNASKEKLDEIIHVGLTVAEYIIEERPFNSLDDLVNVRYISSGYLAKIKEQGLACVGEEHIEETKEDNQILETIEYIHAQDDSVEESPTNYKTPIQSHTIELTKNIKSENNTKEKDKSVYAKYGFIIFCVLLGVLLILKKNKHRKNEFRQ